MATAIAKQTTTDADVEAIIAERLPFWQNDPILFMIEALDVEPDYVWDKMREVAYSVRDNQKTAVGAGHTLSKTFLAPRIALWFLFCFRPSTVITTGPSHNQVENQFWRELSAAYHNARIPLGPKSALTKTRLDLQGISDQIWFAQGIATRPDTVTAEATKLQGFHNTYMMVVVDEGAGVVSQIWAAIQYLLGGHPDKMKLLAQGNPTSDTGEFASILGDEIPGMQENGWNYINISGLDSPNYKAREEIIPGVATYEFVEGIRKKYGEESNEWQIRILGKKPDFSEATFWGKQLARAQAGNQLGFYPHEPRSLVYTASDIGDMYSVFWFFQAVRDMWRMVDFYYDSSGQGLPAYGAMLREKALKYDYRYGEHFGPWDIGGGDARSKQGSNAKSVQTGKFFLEMAAEQGIEMTSIEKYSVQSQRTAAGDMIGRFQFNQETCQEGWNGLRGFRKKKDETNSTTDKPVYFSEPVKNWAEHVGSAFCTVTMAILEYIEVDGVRIGDPDPVAALQAVYRGETQQPAYDVFSRGVRRIG